jgi:hypothetical protein
LLQLLVNLTLQGGRAVNTHLTHNLIFALVLLLLFASTASGQAGKHLPPSWGRLAVVVDERLSALRASPDLAGKLLQRISRGRIVAISGRSGERDGVVFYRVRVTKRTFGWIQREAVVSPAMAADDRRLLRLILASEDFDRLARARIFLDTFLRSNLRPEVLQLYAETAEAAAARLSRDAARRLDEKEMVTGEAPKFSYFLNYNALDRYNRQGVTFIFDRDKSQFHYNGRAWKEIVTRYPSSAAASEARKRLQALSALTAK